MPPGIERLVRSGALEQIQHTFQCGNSLAFLLQDLGKHPRFHCHFLAGNPICPSPLACLFRQFAFSSAVACGCGKRSTSIVAKLCHSFGVMLERSNEAAPPPHLGGLPEGGHCSDVLGTRQKRRSNLSIRVAMLSVAAFLLLMTSRISVAQTMRNGA